MKSENNYSNLKGIFVGVFITLFPLVMLVFLFRGDYEVRPRIDVIKELHENILPNINSIEIYNRISSRTGNLCLRIDNEDELKVFSEGLSSIDKKKHRGRNLPTHEFTLIIYANNDRHQYFGSILNKHPDDVFIEKSEWKDEGESMMSKIFYGNFRAPNFAEFIKERLSTCQ